VQARDGTTWFTAGDRVAWLMPLVAGATADPARAAHRDAAAAALARIHATGAELRLAQRPYVDALPQLQWPPLVVPPPVADLADEIAGAREWAIRCVRRLATERRPLEGFVHGDFFPGNVMTDGDRVTGILDWEEARLDWVSWDLANALGTFCFAGDDLDREAARRFLAAYRAGGGTAPRSEEDLLVPLMRVKRTLEVLRAPTDREPRWEHQRHNLRAMRKLGVG
jgi:Ser/Thr protein kinase RdoA (MazF antagonist)